MPLHLLGKKGWNVYNADNIARVQRDEAEAAAREEAEDLRSQQEDARRLMSKLRGEQPVARSPSPPSSSSKAASITAHAAQSCQGAQHTPSHSAPRRRRRGEDDTDRDIRYAREQLARSEHANKNPAKGDGNLAKSRRTQQDRYRDAPLQDAAGNIQLFPEQADAQRASEDDTQQARKRRRKDDAGNDEEARGVRLGAVAAARPWYATARPGQSAIAKSSEAFPNSLSSHALQAASSTLAETEAKDAWGNTDPRRISREQARLTSGDPFAAMQRAQLQLKQSERDRQDWNEAQREEQQPRQKCLESRRAERRPLDDLDDDEFRLDAEPAGATQRERHRGHHTRPRHGEHGEGRHRKQHRHRHRKNDRDRIEGERNGP